MVSEANIQIQARTWTSAEQFLWVGQTIFLTGHWAKGHFRLLIIKLAIFYLNFHNCQISRPSKCLVLPMSMKETSGWNGVGPSAEKLTNSCLPFQSCLTKNELLSKSQAESTNQKGPRDVKANECQKLSQNMHNINFLVLIID